jgi:hypothetical protein
LSIADCGLANCRLPLVHCGSVIADSGANPKAGVRMVLQVNPIRQSTIDKPQSAIRNGTSRNPQSAVRNGQAAIGSRQSAVGS